MENLKNNLIKQLHLLMAIYFAYGFYVIYDEHTVKMEGLNATLNTIKGKIAIEDKKLKKLNTFRENLEQTKKRVNSVTEQITMVQKQLPTDVNDTEVLEFLTKEARALNIKNPNMNPLKEDLNGFYFTKNYQMKGVGTYLQFLILFERIASSERLFNVQEILFEKEEDGEKGRFRTANMLAKLQAFRYNEAHQERSGIKEIEQKFKEKAKNKPKGRKR